MDTTVKSALESLLKLNLDALENTTMWLFVVLVVCFLAIVKNEKIVKLGSIEIAMNYSGVMLYLVLCGINFKVFSCMQIISHVLFELKNQESTVSILHLHPWVFNPFRKTSGLLGYFSDYLGFPILIIIWWLGFALAHNLVSTIAQEIVQRIIKIAFFTYLVIGLLTMITIQNIFLLTGFDGFRILSQLIGIFLGFRLFYFITNKLLIIKQLFMQEPI